MKDLPRKLRRMRHAGLGHTCRVIYTRAARRAMATPLGRRLVPAVRPVDDAAVSRALGDRAAELFSEEHARLHYLADAAASAALVRETFPEGARATIAKADAICRHEFSFLGKTAAFGASIDWHWLPEGEGSWPVRPSHRYTGSNSYYDPSRPGDIKYPWELNRHQYFVTLGKAWRHTGDERYVRECVAQAEDWLAANPLGAGVNWISAMEFGIRLIAWSDAWWLFRDNAWFRAEGWRPFLRGMYLHARYLERRMTTDWLVRTNHLICEAAGLYQFAALFPQFPESARWRRRALRHFTREVCAQVYADGVNAEQATGYHRFVADFILGLLRLGEVQGTAMPRALRERLSAMIAYEAAIIAPDGKAPQIGDCDDGRGFVYDDTDDFFDFRPWLAAGAVLLDAPEFAGAARGGGEEALWLLGPAGWERFQEMARAAEPAAPASRYFSEGGQAVLRRGDHYVMLRCGSFGHGEDGASAHSHADMLAPVIHWRGRPLAVDAGTFAYYCAAETRDRFRGTAMHNTMAPRGVEQAPMYTMKDWGAVPRTRVTAWDAAGAALTAEMEAPGQYRHRRRIVLEADALVIEDALTRLDADASGALDWRLHLAPGLDAETTAPGELRIVGADGALARLRHSGFNAARVEDSAHSPRYGVLVESRCIVLSADGPRAETRAVIDDPPDPA